MQTEETSEVPGIPKAVLTKAAKEGKANWCAHKARRQALLSAHTSAHGALTAIARQSEHSSRRMAYFPKVEGKTNGLSKSTTTAWVVKTAPKRSLHAKLVQWCEEAKC